MVDLLAENENKVKSLRLYLRYMKWDFEKNDEELLHVKGWNYEINQWLVRIMEEKVDPHVNYMSQMLDVKLIPTIS